MNRRKFLRALAAIPLVGSVPALAAYKRRESITVDVPSSVARDEGSRVEVDLTSRNGGTVKVNGHDLSRVCCGIELVRNANEFGRVKLTLIPKSIRVNLDGAAVEMIEKHLTTAE